MSELDKKLMQTPDLNKERLEKLKSLFPDLFTVEGKLNPDELKKIIDPDLVKETERFEFKWFGKSEAKRNAFTPSKATLVYDEKRSVNPEYADGNMIIEGENLETMKCLLAGYKERVKCIYIDPPYNTGRDFLYSDRWDESTEDYWEHIGVSKNGVQLDTNMESDGSFHSKWLNMIFSRLLVARQLLTDDGVIFISIGDEEVSNFRKVLDEVFGSNNFIALVPRVAKTTSFRGKFFAPSKDYVMVYSKDITTLSKFRDDIDESQYYKIEEDGEREGEKYRDDIAFYLSTLETRPNQRYFIECPDGEKVIPPGKTFPPEKPIYGDGVWRWNYDSFEENYDLIVFKKSKQSPLITDKGKKASWNLYTKSYLNDKLEVGNLPRDFITEYLNRQGTSELKKLGIPYDFPKPSELIKFLIKIVNSSKGSIVLDFFAGSGTTAHSVISLNQEDNGNRKFILVQIPEYTKPKSKAYEAGFVKLSDITIERNKRVIEQIEKNKLEKQTSLLYAEQKPFKTGFKVYKLAKSNFPRVDFAPDPAKTEEENLALLNQYIDEKEVMYLAMIDEKNIFDEVLLKNGFMLNYSKKKLDGFSKNKVFQIKDDFKECLICMDMAIKKETLKELEQYKDKIFICLERALDTTMKWNLKHLFGEKLIAF